VARIGDRSGAHRILVGRPEAKRQLGRRRHRWEDNIKMVLQEVRWGDMDCIHLTQDGDRWRALVNVVMNFVFHKMQGISWLTENLLKSE